MVGAACLGLASETPMGAPHWHQLALWAGAIVAFLIGYTIHRLGGGTFRFRDMIE